MSPLPELKLTRAVEADPRREAIEVFLKKDCRTLWEQSALKIPHVPFLPALETYLKLLLNRRQLERGLEHIDQLLNTEQKGLSAIQEKKGAKPSQRVSRLLLVTNDGSERFYRACEKTLLRNSDRLLLVYVDESSSRLSEILLGETNKSIKALLVSDRDAVSGVLFSLLGESLVQSLQSKPL